MIIAFSGRKQSGKTTLSKLVIGHGFTKISFADKLKELIGSLYDLPSDSVQGRNKEILLKRPLAWNKRSARKFEKLADIPFGSLDSANAEFVCVRQALQYIGTDILRKYDNDIHVKWLSERLRDEENYVLDDLRFPNELALMQQLSANCFYIIRPFNFEYSNHYSETALTRHDFDKVLVNSCSLVTFKKKFSKSLKRLFSKKKYFDLSREQFVSLLESCNFDTTVAAKKLGCSRDKIVWWTTNYWVYLPRTTVKINENAFSEYNEKSAYWAGLFAADGTIKTHQGKYLWEFSNTDKELVYGMRRFLESDKHIYIDRRDSPRKDSYTLTFSNPFLLEDMKLWNLFPNKSMKEHLPPEVVLNNDNLFNAWLVGLIDGDGSVYKSRQYKGNIHIKVLGSWSIVNYVRDKYKIPCSRINQERNNKGKKIPLFNFCYTGKYAVDFYRRVYRGQGLKRKWNKFSQEKSNAQ